MAVYSFSALSDGQAISFDPNSDVLDFDQTSISAADLAVAAEGSDVRIVAAGKSVLLQSVSPLELASSNVSFANGSALLFGDNSPGTANDNAANSLSGTSGNDLLQGFGGADTLNGGAGDDRYLVGTGDVLVDAGGIDTVVSDINWALGAGFENLTLAGSANINGAGNDLANLIIQNDGNNVTWAGRGNDTVLGGAGNDYLGGDANNDWLDGQAGNDTLDGGGDKDHFAFSLYGAANADTAVAFASNWDDVQLDIATFGALGTNGQFSSSDARFYAAAGATSGHDADDRIIYNTSTGQLFYDADGSGAGAAQIIGTFQGAPTLRATDIHVYGTPASSGGTTGTEGDDTLVGTSGDDTINALGGDDSISGLDGSDSLSGGDGNDTLDGGAGVDTLDGGLGNDTYIVTTGDVLSDAGGIDTVISPNSAWTLGPGLENLRVSGLSGTGNELDNVITNDDMAAPGSPLVLNGLAGNDTLIGSAGAFETFAFTGDYGNDVVDGGAPGSDELDIGDSSAVLVDFRDGTATGGGPGGSGTVSFTNVARASGGAFDDTLIGADGSNALAGNDGNDLLNGGAGNDFLNGGFGADRFVFDQTGTANADQVGDFSSGVDQIHLDATAMPALGTSGGFTVDDPRFYAADGATAGHDADDRVVYDTSTGNLYYDPDGSGTSAAQILGTISFGGPATVTATDVFVDNGTAPSGTINGTDGDDTLVGTSGDDTINGLGGNDSISGLEGDDSLSGGDGNDTLDGGSGTNTVDGGLGDDTYILGEGSDTFVDAGGVDTIISYGIFTPLPADIENLVLRGGPFFPGNDIYTSEGLGNDLDNLIVNERPGPTGLDGGPGDDTLIGSAQGTNWFRFSADATGNYGNDVVDGNGGTAILLAPGTSATIDFRNGTMTGGGTGSVSFSRIDIAQGTSGADMMIGDDSGVHLYGDAGNDTLVGGAGSDYLTGDGYITSDAPEFTIGDDSLSGGDGNDTLAGGRGDDVLDGGTGNDVVWYFMETDYGNDTLDGGDGVDTVVMGNGSLVVVDLAAGTMTGGIYGGSASSAALTNIENFELQGTASPGDISGSEGANLLAGADGQDTMDGAGGNDTLTGGANADRFVFDHLGAANADHITDFVSGEDEIDLDATVMTELGASGAFAAGDARFYATAGASGGHDGDDRVVYDTASGNLWYDADGSGATAALLIATLDGPAVLAATDIVVLNGTTPPSGPINGTSGDDSLVGTAGDDTINGLEGNDTLVGLGGNDVLDGGPGIDSMDGGAGDDSYYVTAGDVLTDASGVDTVLSDGDWSLGLDFENITLLGTGNWDAQGFNADNLAIGNAGDNYFNMRDGNDTILAGAGDDSIDMSTGGTSSYGNDSIDGGDGMDTVDFAGYARSGVMVNLALGTLAGGGDAGAGSATIANVERVIGGDFNDSFAGDSQGNQFDGRAGDDTLAGGAGNDRLIGGAGADSFVFADVGTANADSVSDFTTGSDEIHLDADAMAALGTSGQFSSADARFYEASGASSGHDADDRVIFDTASGNLWYDADGSGAGSALLIATLQGAASLAATDIFVENGSAPPPPPPGSMDGTSGNDSLVGTTGDDTINGLEGNDTLRGLDGNDVLDGGPGTDLLDGGAGDDTYYVTGGDTLTDSGGVDTVLSGVDWSLGAGFENLTLIGSADLRSGGNDLANLITQNSGDNVTWAGRGDDTIFGGDGNDYLGGDANNDWLDGQAGNDTLDGGGDKDHFVFSSYGAANADLVRSFATGWDDLKFDASAFGALGASGDFGSDDARFYAASGASAGHDADDRLIYDTSTGQLYYDDDGSGSHAAQLVATLEGAPSLAANDISVI